MQIRPTEKLSLTGFPNQPVSSGIAKGLIEEFEATGISMHSSSAQTAWLTIEHCRAKAIPFKVIKGIEECGNSGVAVIRANHPDFEQIPSDEYSVLLDEASDGSDFGNSLG